MRLLLILLLSSARTAFALSPPADADATRVWLVRALGAELGRPGTDGIPDLNLIASVAFPLADDLRRRPDEQVRQVLERTGGRLARLDPAALSCEGVSDYALTAAFLRDAGLAAPPPPPPERLAACLGEGDEFALANGLIMACRYRLPTPAGYRERGLARIAALQRDDGSFADARGRSGYYLTSHALLALHFCGGHDPQVARGAGLLRAGLERFARAGFLDGLAESLIFLRWLGVAVPEEADYRAYLFGRTHPDGALCLFDRPGCEAHWHPTSLLLELGAE